MGVLFDMLLVLAVMAAPLWLGALVLYVVVGGMGILTCIFGSGYTELDD